MNVLPDMGGGRWIDVQPEKPGNECIRTFLLEVGEEQGNRVSFVGREWVRSDVGEDLSDLTDDVRLR